MSGSSRGTLLVAVLLMLGLATRSVPLVTAMPTRVSEIPQNSTISDVSIFRRYPNATYTGLTPSTPYIIPTTKPTVLPDPLVSPPGGAGVYVLNHCSFTVVSNIAHGPAPGSPLHLKEILSSLPARGQAFYRFSIAPGIGISWKLGTTEISPIQLEWTWQPEQKRTYWDLSMIDAYENDPPYRYQNKSDEGGPAVGRLPLHAFARYGMKIDVSRISGGDTRAGYPSCEPVRCEAGNNFCSMAYNFAEDWSQQRSCADDVDMVMTLCE